MEKRELVRGDKGIESYETSENMKLFFENLSNLKIKIAKEFYRTEDKFLGEIYKELNRFYKVKGEKKYEEPK